MRRRQFLLAGAGLGAGALADRAARPGAAPAASAPPHGDPLHLGVRFDGAHQAGILTPRPRHALFVVLDSVAPGRPELAEAVATVSDRARRLTRGFDALLGSPTDGPTPDGGSLGPRVLPDGLTVTVGFGASLFDDRYGLGGRRPAGLTAMPTFPDDDLDPAQSHGDLLLQLCAGTQETLLHAQRELLRATRSAFAVRWQVEGFTAAAREPGASRNHLGFKDGSANPDPTDRRLMERLVWTPEGGTFAAVRVIRNRVEFWDRVGRREQELMIGRDKAVGAPLGRRAEGDDPGYADDPRGERIPLDAHIRLARPRTDATEAERILRRPFNYARGVDPAGQLDMGLLFVSYQRSLQRQFEAVQRRLAGEPLVDYVTPVGGGYFFLPPGARGDDDWVGSALLS